MLYDLLDNLLARIILGCERARHLLFRRQARTWLRRMEVQWANTWGDPASPLVAAKIQAVVEACCRLDA